MDKLNCVWLVYITIPKSEYVVEQNDDRNKFILWTQSKGNIIIWLDEGNYSNPNKYGDLYDIKFHLVQKLNYYTNYNWTITKYLYPNTETGK